jgi:hypothetical protein
VLRSHCTAISDGAYRPKLRAAEWAARFFRERDIQRMEEGREIK